MFDKVLVANRGEIACRIFRTLRRMGIRSVAVYSEADARARHVALADEAVPIGPASAQESYLSIAAIVRAARAAGARGVHPGYGFLSESADFAEACENAQIRFIGPSPEQIRAFGLKHSARELAARASVPMLPGSPLIADVESARAWARDVGYPVMLKSSAGGGGIGLKLCPDESRLAELFESVERLSRNNFDGAGVFLERFVERARHLEVQIFGDGRGRVIALGVRDCSLQRRNQKVVEETPAEGLEPELEAELVASAIRLASSVGYESAGTVEFIFDVDLGRCYFLEVNTRLQVEHGVTEAVTGVDLVEWMVRQAASDFELPMQAPLAAGHAIEARLYAEDPARQFQPSSGSLSEVIFPSDVRVDGWIERGSVISPYYDPMLAKIIVHAGTRKAAIESLRRALEATRISGVETNLEYLEKVVGTEEFERGQLTTGFLAEFRYRPQTIEVVHAGTQSTIQDYPGRLGYWAVGIPPSGPMDALSFRLANRIAGNPDGAPGLELTVSGPTLRFHTDAVIALTGADMPARLDGKPVPRFTPITISAGQELELAEVAGPGARSYLAVRHGFDVPSYLGSAATFTLGGFGGHAGRALRPGDVLRVRPPSGASTEPKPLPELCVPELGSFWELGVLYGPHGAPDFFTNDDIDTFFSTDWEVHYNSARTGVRLIGPKPTWARPDGGEAGLHPSNIHDCAYAVGTVDFTGDMPILLGPDGPSLGGFVCPASVVESELWKLGQLKPGDRVRFVALTLEQARAAKAEQERLIIELSASLAAMPVRASAPRPIEGAVLRELSATAERARVTYRRAGDCNVLVEYGEMVLDLELRFRVHALMQALEKLQIRGIVDLTPGIRSLQVHYQPAELSLASLLARLVEIEAALPPVDALEVPTRIVHLPLSWDDEAAALAVEKYTQIVRKDAPWAPSNIEFIRRINGLSSIDAVKEIVFGASYLVLGLGDVYLGAPVATPVDPRHRLVTTKYNPARTWTPENAVGIGGAYLCIYGMEGPGGYQLVGRTLQVYSRYRQTADFKDGKPWLLRFFDQIRFYPVSGPTLLELRDHFAIGRHTLTTQDQSFRLADYRRFLGEQAESIAAFKSRQQAAFEAERQRWLETGQFVFASESEAPETSPRALNLPPGGKSVVSPVPGSVWKIGVAPGNRVEAGDTLVVVESMKMEIAVASPIAGTVHDVLCSEGRPVSAGQPLVVVRAAP